MAELHAVEVAAMLAADADFELVAAAATLLDAPLDQHADTFGVERLERIGCKHASLLFIDIVGQETARVVAGEAHGGLGEVVGAEGEELGALCDLIGHQSGTWEFDHGADDVVELRAGLLDDVVGDATSGVLKDGELFLVE